MTSVRRILAAAALVLLTAVEARGAGFECPLPAQALRLITQRQFAEAVPLLRARMSELPDSTAAAQAKARVCVISMLAATLSQTGEKDEAIALQSANAAAAARLLPEDDPVLLQAQMHLATIQQSRGDYDASIPLLRALVPRIERAHGSASVELATVLRNTATALHWVGNFTDALPYDQRHLRITRQLRPGVDCEPQHCSLLLANSLSNMADTLRRVQRDAEAENLLREALTIYATVVAPTHAKLLDAQLTLASVLANLGRGAEAESLEREVARIAEETLGSRDPLTLKAKGNLAVTLSRTDPKASIRMGEERVRQLTTTLGDGHPDTLQAIQNLAVSHLKAGEADKALPLLRSAVSAWLARPDALDFDDRSGAAFLRSFSELMDVYLVQLLRAGRVADAFLLTEQLKARDLAARIGGFDTARTLEPDLLAQRRALRGRIAVADQNIALARSVGRSEGLSAAERAALAQQWKRSAASTGEKLAETGSQPRWTGRLPGVASALVSYRFVKHRLLAFVVQQGRVHVLELDPAGVVRPTVEALRLAMREKAKAGPKSRAQALPLWRLAGGGYGFSTEPMPDGTRAASVDEVLAFLHARVVAPLLPHLPVHDRLLISIDGNLAHLPFDALPHEKGRLGDRYAVALLPTFTMLEALSVRAAGYQLLAREPLLAIGGARYSRLEQIAPSIHFQRERPVLQQMDLKVAMQSVRRNQKLLPLALNDLARGWPDLPGTAAEVDLISRALLPDGAGGLLLLREQASEARLNALASEGRLRRFRYIHFATHGFLSDDEPGLSAVVLSQLGRAPGTDGYLTAAEIAALELQADLVVVSACDSGAGPAPAGVAATGLAGAFFEAGSNASILTLWPVPDRDTPRFMQQLYMQLARGEPPATALQKAKRWGRAEGLPPQLVDAFVAWGLD